MARDYIDALCEDWARTRRQLTGLKAPALGREYIGPWRSTLGQRRDLHAGARSSGRVEQHWPEVYLGDAALINRAYQAMRPPMKLILDVHYTIERPRTKAQRAEILGISGATYWKRVGEAKQFLEGALAVSGNLPAR